jgi:hypothetical protein
MVFHLTPAQVLAILDCTTWTRRAIADAESVTPENRQKCLEAVENLRAEVEKQLRPQLV